MNDRSMKGLAVCGLLAVGALVLGLPSLAQAGLITLNDGTVQPFITSLGGDTYQFQYRIASSGGDGNGSELVDTTASGLAESVSNVTPLIAGPAGVLTLASNGSGQVIYHLQAESGYMLSNVSVASNWGVSAGTTVTILWGTDGSTWDITPLETGGPVAENHFNDLVNVSGFTTGTDLYLQYNMVGTAQNEAIFAYVSGTASGFMVVYDLIPPVPEPSTWKMLAVGGLALLGYWGFRRRARSK